jgi:hypothetical protein
MFKSLRSLATGAVLAVTLVSAAHAEDSVAATNPSPAASPEASATKEAAPNPDSAKAVDMLFEAKHIVAMAGGTELHYKFERLPSNEKILGLGFTDDIKLKIEGDGAPGKKNVVVEMFTGDRAREPDRITDMDSNPMLLVYLDAAVGHFQLLAGGDRPYFKNKFRKSLAASSTLSPVKIAYKGQDVDGYRVSVTPFIDDPARAKMRGFEVAEFSIVLSDKIPGQFAQMISNYKNSEKDAPTLVEKTTLDGVGEVK